LKKSNIGISRLNSAVLRYRREMLQTGALMPT
jgi:hypothetical protein